MTTPAAPVVRSAEGGAPRLRPGLTHARYYMLRKLAAAIRAALQQAAQQHPGGRLLDYGCGNQPYRPLATATGLQYVGADLAWSTGADLVLATDGRIPAADASFDVVLSNQVLEHVPDPPAYLAEAGRVLRPGGTLILSTHGHWMYHPDPVDYWRWTSAGLQRVVQAAGFDVLGHRGILNRAAAGLQLFQDGMLFKFPPALRPVWTVPMQGWIALFDQLSKTSTRDADAAVFVIQARKGPAHG